jgi:hydroxyethylthiazole kinase-like sugar kinase family protein
MSSGCILGAVTALNIAKADDPDFDLTLAGQEVGHLAVDIAHGVMQRAAQVTNAFTAEEAAKWAALLDDDQLPNDRRPS